MRTGKMKWKREGVVSALLALAFVAACDGSSSKDEPRLGTVTSAILDPGDQKDPVADRPSKAASEIDEPAKSLTKVGRECQPARSDPGRAALARRPPIRPARWSSRGSRWTRATR
jgi:hypothetical protein